MSDHETREFGSVWDALEEATNLAPCMKARSEVLIAIQETVTAWGITQTEAASRIGVTQPRLNDLLKGRIDRFSLDALVKFAAGAGLSVEWSVRPAA